MITTLRNFKHNLKILLFINVVGLAITAIHALDIFYVKYLFVVDWTNDITDMWIMC